MKSSYTFPIIVFFVLLTFFLVSCGSTSVTSSSGKSGSSAVPTATTDTNASSGKDYPTYGKNYSTPTTTTQNTNATAIKIATATVNGKSATILTNAQGMSLYYFTPDTKTNAACTGGCAGTWPPFLAAGSNAPTSATTLPGKFAAISSANGTQVQYNNHFLYTYAGDSAPHQTNGEGIGGKWFVATTDLI